MIYTFPWFLFIRIDQKGKILYPRWGAFSRTVLISIFDDFDAVLIRCGAYTREVLNRIIQENSFFSSSLARDRLLQKVSQKREIWSRYMQNHRAKKMLGVDFSIFNFCGQKSAIFIEKWKNLGKNQLQTFFRPYGSAYLVQISCL